MNINELIEFLKNKQEEGLGELEVYSSCMSYGYISVFDPEIVSDKEDPFLLLN